MIMLHAYNLYITNSWSVTFNTATLMSYHKNTLYTIMKISVQHELLTKLLLEIFSNVGRWGTKI